MCGLYITDCPPFQLPNGKFCYLSIKPIQADGRCKPIITINAQMPGPTIIVHEGQALIVYNELKNDDSISIH